MDNKSKRLLLLSWLCSLSLLAQEKPSPPVPGMAVENNPCGDPPPGLPPPVGLPCLPIDEYIIPMLLAGLVLGTYILVRVKAQGLEELNSS